VWWVGGGVWCVGWVVGVVVLDGVVGGGGGGGGVCGKGGGVVLGDADGGFCVLGSYWGKEVAVELLSCGGWGVLFWEFVWGRLSPCRPITSFLPGGKGTGSNNGGNERWPVADTAEKTRMLQRGGKAEGKGGHARNS